MVTVLKLVAIVMGFLFPNFLIKAIRAKDENDVALKYIPWSCISFGSIVLIIMFALPIG